MLLTAVVGSGIMGERLQAGNVAIAVATLWTAGAWCADSHLWSNIRCAFQPIVGRLRRGGLLWAKCLVTCTNRGELGRIAI